MPEYWPVDAAPVDPPVLPTLETSCLPASSGRRLRASAVIVQDRNVFGLSEAASSQRLLWIDDQILSDIGTVRLLEFELGNLTIECAVSGAEGLRLALTGEYAGIVLDLRLPDIDGLTVLERIKAAGIRTPVLVVSGWADVDSAVAATKLGAVNVKSKPLTSDELIETIRALLVRRGHIEAVGRGDALATGLSVRRTTAPFLAVSERRSFTVTQAAHLLVEPILSALDFVALARCFRATMFRDSRKRPTVARETPVQFSEPAIWRRLPGDYGQSPNSDETEMAGWIVAVMEKGLAEGRLPSEEEVAAQRGVRASDIHRILKSHTGATFRETRRALRIRNVVREIACSTEQIAQIAYKHHYEHAGQLDRDFVRTFGLSPRQFRRYFRRAPPT